MRAFEFLHTALDPEHVETPEVHNGFVRPVRNITGDVEATESSSARVGIRRSAKRVWLEDEPATMIHSPAGVAAARVVIFCSSTAMDGVVAIRPSR